jgi:UPF0716 protein FxsA
MPFVLFLIWPLLEIFVFFKVCALIGVFHALLLSFLVLLLGLGLIWRQGFEAVFSLGRVMAMANGPPPRVFETICLTIAGLLFVIPGFLSDIAALLLLLPPVRARLRIAFIAHLQQAQSFHPGAFHATSPSQPPTGDIIEGDYERLDEADSEQSY